MEFVFFRLATMGFRANACGVMYTHFDPEGEPSVLTENSVLTLNIPAGQNVHLYASFDSAWEQAVVVHVGRTRYNHQLGNYLRPTSLVIPKQAEAFELALIAWHKRSDANPNLPWIASRGQRIGPVVFAWDDSAGDGDYRDVRIKLVTS